MRRERRVACLPKRADEFTDRDQKYGRLIITRCPDVVHLPIKWLAVCLLGTKTVTQRRATLRFHRHPPSRANPSQSQTYLMPNKNWTSSMTWKTPLNSVTVWLGDSWRRRGVPPVTAMSRVEWNPRSLRSTWTRWHSTGKRWECRMPLAPRRCRPSQPRGIARDSTGHLS